MTTVYVTFSNRIPLKQNPPKFLLEHLLAFLLKFTPTKISCYTVQWFWCATDFLYLLAWQLDDLKELTRLQS